jgi:hypothetical protein
MVERAAIEGRTMKTRGLLLAAIVLAVVGLGAIFAAKSAPALELSSFSAAPSLTQAGGHPDLTIAYSGESRNAPKTTNTCQCNDLMDFDVSLPAGFIGNPHATPQCNAANFARETCPGDSQVGVITYSVELGGGVPLTFANEPVYNTLPRPTQAGLLSVKLVAGLLGIPLYTVLAARTGSDYGLDARTDGLQRMVPLQTFTFRLWGVPADDIHTPLRYGSLANYEVGVPSSSPLTPFLQNPGVCDTNLTTVARTTGYDGSSNSAEDAWPKVTGCDQLTFNPSLSARPTTTEADSASGLDVDLTVPQFLSPTLPSPSAIKAATVTLPEGFAINPNAADGKISCSDAAANFGTEDEAHCPEFSKVGSLTIDSPALPQPIPGAIYLGDPLPGDRYRAILTADGFATHIKIAGRVDLDPQTGQVVFSFPNLPEAPLSRFNLHVFGSERGLLATPTQCGTYPVKSTFVPWDNELPSQSATQFFTLDKGPGGAPCPPPLRPFSPRFSASSTSNAAGSHTPFTVEFDRDDGDQTLSGLQVTAPPGFSATLAGVPSCSDSAIAAAADASYFGLTEISTPSCPIASQIGTAVAGAGAGTHQVYLDGKVYLAGPYKGAPLSLVVVTPAVTGPYDLGNVVVRAAIEVDPVDAHVTAFSDPLPQIVEGIPIRLREVRVNLDRDGFTLNPTNCDPFQVGAFVLGDQGGQSALSSHFQVANCSALDFAPKLALKLTGSTKQADNPALTATLTAKPGEANISRAQVTLPPTELVDNAHIRNICTRVQFNEGNTPGEKCPPGSILGFARADTPLLEKPLEGPIFLRSTGRAGLPDVVAALNGQIDIVLIGHVDSVRGALRTTFETVPDAPVAKVVFSFYGGHRGLIENSPKLCARVQHFTAAITGQNGETVNRRPVLSTPCGKKPKRKARAHHNRRAHR